MSRALPWPRQPPSSASKVRLWDESCHIVPPPRCHRSTGKFVILPFCGAESRHSRAGSLSGGPTWWVNGRMGVP